MFQPPRKRLWSPARNIQIENGQGLQALPIPSCDGVPGV